MSMSTQNEIILILFISFCVNHVQLIQNEIIISLCVDSRHIVFISFYVNSIRSVSNDKNFVICYDRWHNYSIVLIFDELLKEFFFRFFLYQYCHGFRLFVIHRRSQRYTFLRHPCIRPSIPPIRPHFLSVLNHISVLI